MIYENHFSLNQRPFTIAPNPEFLYASGQYQEALAALEYGMLHRGGFVLLTGEVGTGKTTLCKYLLNKTPKNTEVALILHPQLDRLEMLQLICREFNVDFKRDNTELELIERLTEFLLSIYAKGGYCVLIIDEAQHLDSQVLELIRLLTNLETHQDKLLQIILLGQPELKERLQQYHLRQLNQRFTARYHLSPLSFSQLRDYVNYRIRVAGGKDRIFSWLALFKIHLMSGGIPRLINLIADRSLMGGYATDKQSIGYLIASKAGKEVISKSVMPSFLNVKGVFAVCAFLLMLMVSLFSLDMKQAINSVVANIPSMTIKSQGELDFVRECQAIEDCWQGTLPLPLLLAAHSNNPVAVEALKIGVYSSEDKNWVSLDTYSEGVDSYASLPKLINSKILWPNINRAALKQGDVSEEIPAIRVALDQWSGVDVDTTQDDIAGWEIINPAGDRSKDALQFDRVYDLLLESRVKSFQKNNGLIVDGVIGGQTMLALKLFRFKGVK